MNSAHAAPIRVDDVVMLILQISETLKNLHTGVLYTDSIVFSQTAGVGNRNPRPLVPSCKKRVGIVLATLFYV